MKVHSETVGPFAENAYILADEGTRECVVIDPGDEAPRLLDILRRERLEVRWILATHAHLDHVGAVQAVKEATGAPFLMHEADRPLLDHLSEQAALFGLRAPPVPSVDGALTEGMVLSFGRPAVSLRVLETPGHSPGSVTFVLEGLVVSGDVLFAGSIGRTDLPGGDFDTLLQTLRQKVLTLDDAVVVLPGHGPPTTVGEERRSNPFLQS